MMSCRALGRGVIDALLAWLCHAARAAGASQVAVRCVLTPRNVPLRIALTGAGFRAGDGPAPQAGTSVTYRRRLDGPLPERARLGDRMSLATEIRRLLADLAGDDAALTAPDSTPLLRDGLGLDSLRGTMLLAQISQRYGVDIAADDLNLDSLASIGALTDFLSTRQNST